MDAIKIYRHSLVLAVIAPILFLPLAVALPPVNNNTSGLSDIIQLMVLSGVIGGLPYLIAAALIFSWMHDKSERQIRKTLTLSPLLTASIFGIGGGLLNLLFNNHNVNDLYSNLFYPICFVSISILIFGYSYILLTFGFVRVFRKQ
jgi:hypothetical protein